MESVKSILVGSPLLSHLDQKYIDVINDMSTFETFEAGAELFKQWGSADRFYIINFGQVQVEAETHGEESRPIQVLGRGEVLGWSWIFPPYMWHFTARALVQTKVVSIDGKALREYCEEDKEFGFVVLKRFSQLIVQRLNATRLQGLENASTPTSN